MFHRVALVPETHVAVFRVDGVGRCTVYGINKEGQTTHPNDASTSTSETSTREPLRRARRLALGTVLLIVGRVLVLCGTIMTLAGVPLYPLYFLLMGPNAYLSPLVSVIGALLVIFGLNIHLYGKRLRFQGAERILAEDTRDPIVYLRPFAADAESTEYSEVGLMAEVVRALGAVSPAESLLVKLFRAVPTLIRLAITPPLTDEEQLAVALNVFGPTVAVASPGETLPPAGIPRLSFATSIWQEQVSALLKRARLVVIRCGVSTQSIRYGYWPASRAIEGGFRWELATVATQVAPEKLALLLHFNGLEYENFCWKTQDIFPCTLPPYWNTTSTNGTSRALMWFDTNWSPFLAPITWLDNSLRLDTHCPLVASLRTKFQAVTGRGFNLQYGGSKLGKRLIAVLIDLGVTTLLTFAVAVQLKWLTDATLAPKAALILLPIVAFAYSAFFEASSLMATSGKRLMGLMVVDVNGRRLSLSSAFRRTAIKFFLLPVTWIPALFATDKQTLHDRWSSSIVALGALRVSEPPRRRFAVLTCVAVAMTYLLAIDVITHRSQLHFPRGADQVELAFQSAQGSVAIPASVNGQPMVLVLSTTAAATTIDRITARRVGIKSLYTTKEKVGGKEVSADISIPYDLKLDSLILTNASLHIVDLSTLTGALGPHIDGVIGFDLLSRGIVQIDYPSRKVVIVKPRSFHYDGSGESIPIAIDRRMPSVVATIKVPGHNAVNDTFWLNPGLPGGVNHPLIQQSTTAFSLGSKWKGITIGQIEYIQFGRVRLSGVLSVCCTGLKELDRGVGSTALSQFKVIFDYPNSRVILERQK